MAATYVANYPQLLRTLATDQRIVYLCGAGVSMSLAHHKLSWPNWILARKDYLDAAGQAELDKRIGSWTTEKLIDAVTFLKRPTLCLEHSVALGNKAGSARFGER